MNDSLPRDPYAVVLVEFQNENELSALVREGIKNYRLGSENRFTKNSLKSHFCLTFYSQKDFSRSPNEDKRPEKIALPNKRNAFCYRLLLFKISKTTWGIGAKYTGALKEFFLDFAECSGHLEASPYYAPDIVAINERISKGVSLPGRLTSASLSIDYFGDAGSLIERIVLRGKDVVRSVMYYGVLLTLEGKNPKDPELKDKRGADREDEIRSARTYSIHSTSLLFLHGTEAQRLTLDKFGNLQTRVDLQNSQLPDLKMMTQFIVKNSTLRKVCPLRRKPEEKLDE